MTRCESRQSTFPTVTRRLLPPIVELPAGWAKEKRLRGSGFGILRFGVANSLLTESSATKYEAFRSEGIVRGISCQDGSN